ncbi:toxin B [Listeria sp. FSL L7-0233]|uniref:Toxin B n=2 Tax=Listeria TaxID=1637 RepID=A0ABU2II17_9LIST|nr:MULTISPECIES: toxin B [Listeria]EAC9603459.1 toxin B [Listeria monocytogenes]EAG1285358.1 toxin B [Listeria monocytogenes]EJM2940294.1 toxin B [Listeria monocytogenes]MBC1547160.1 toxin B [Listeria cossartiae subsp. cossartiae]MBC1571729.1 toxin B [Listeria cossartiae subsp. cossartiae]
MSREIKINPIFLKNVENNVTNYIDAQKEVSVALLAVRENLASNFSGIACDEIKNYITELMNDLEKEFGVFITKNHEKVKALGESYKELDGQLGQTFNYGMERTK